MKGRRAEQTLLSNRTLGEKNNWLVVQEEKAWPFWTFICSNHRIMSTTESGSIPLCLKRMWACLIEFESKLNFLNVILPTQTFGLLMPSDFRCWQHVQVWGNLEKQKELIEMSVPSPQAMARCLPSCDPEQKAYSFTPQALWETVTTF